MGVLLSYRGGTSVGHASSSDDAGRVEVATRVPLASYRPRQTGMRTGVVTDQSGLAGRFVRAADRLRSRRETSDEGAFA